MPELAKPSLLSGIISMFWKHLQSIERELAKNLRHAGITTRPSKSNGLWCCLLLPVILILYNSQYKVALPYTLSTYVSIGLLAHNILLTYFLTLTPDVMKSMKYVGCVPCGLVSTLLVYAVMHQDLFVSLALTIPATLAQGHILRHILYNFPNTFTVGEAFVVTQKIVLFGVMSFGKILLKEQVVKGMEFVNTNLSKHEVLKDGLGIVNAILSKQDVANDKKDFINTNVNKPEDKKDLIDTIVNTPEVKNDFINTIVNKPEVSQDKMELMNTIVDKYEVSNDEIEFVNTILYALFVTVTAILTALAYLPDQERIPFNLMKILTTAAAVLLTALHVLFGRGFILMFMNYIFMNPYRAQILLYWLFLVLVAVVIVYRRTGSGQRADTSTRKCFHILASLVFLPGILLDREFMMLAAGVAFQLLIFVEALRKSGIEPFSSALQNAFNVYSDEKDAGSFAVTPIYMFIGLATPLILRPRGHHGNGLESLSGVLSIGVGDTAASYFGSKYGRHKWAGSNRTMEGTAANIISQVALVYVLQLYGFLEQSATLRVLVAATASSLVEAKTEQVDNLILPLITIIAFQFTSFL